MLGKAVCTLQQWPSTFAKPVFVAQYWESRLRTQCPCIDGPGQAILHALGRLIASMVLLQAEKTCPRDLSFLPGSSEIAFQCPKNGGTERVG